MDAIVHAQKEACSFRAVAPGCIVTGSTRGMPVRRAASRVGLSTPEVIATVQTVQAAALEGVKYASEGAKIIWSQCSFLDKRP